MYSWFVLIIALFAAPSDDLQVSLRARSLQPGEAVLVTCTSIQSLKSLQGTVFGKTIPFYLVEGKWQGLVGIDLDAAPGEYELRLEGTAEDGRSVVLPYAFTVSSKEFPTRRLTVHEKFVSPPQEVLDRIEREAARNRRIFATVTEARLWAGPFGLPVDGESTSSFGKRSILNGKPRSPHSGTDFRAGEGTPIRAPNSGRVVLADDLYFSGNCVILDHGLGLYSYFAHLSGFNVKEGQRVNQGDVVGYVGATGRVTGPHLHWTVRLPGARVDPFSLMHILSDR
ncbi:MAG: M23 family metallopeptidase [Acidobacteriota bacterium]